MKKFLTLTIIVLMLLPLVACGRYSNNVNENVNEYEWEELEWPKYDNAKQIPIPKSTTVDIRNCHDIRFEFYVADTTLEDYKNYVEKCKTKGFTIDAVEQECRYFALNKDKYELTVEYVEGDVMYIEVVEYRCDIEFKLLHSSKESADCYDIRIEIDGGWEDDGEKGKEAVSFDSLLKEGKHTLTVENDDDDDINGRIDFVVTEDGEYFEFEISCSSKKIDIQQIQEKETNRTEQTSLEDTTNKNESTTIKETTTKKETTTVKESTTVKKPTTVKETTTEKNYDNYVYDFDPYDCAVLLCQSIKDSLYNPDSIQINKVYYTDVVWHNYYIDISAMNQMGGYSRETYEAVINKDSTLYSFDKVYDLPDVFDENEYKELDTDIIEYSLK